MGFTIGTIGGVREGQDEVRGPRPGVWRRGRSASAALTARSATAMAEYTGLWGWQVVPGAHVVRDRGRIACSCGDDACAAPGAHPVSGASCVPAGATLAEAGRAWTRHPGASVLLPVGAAFDVVEVSGAVARRAVARHERMGLPLGPVALTPLGRAWFLVAPGGAAELPGLLYRLGWEDARLDLAVRGPGDHITAPPSELGGHGPVTWLRPPAPERAGRPPHARLLLGTLAYLSRR